MFLTHFFSHETNLDFKGFLILKNVSKNVSKSIDFLIQYRYQIDKPKGGLIMADTLGYARVSTEGQSLDRQIDALIAAGVSKKHLYTEKFTGTKADRPELNRLLGDLEAGDTIIITDLTRISRSTKDLLDIVSKIKDRGCYIKSLKDTWLDTTASNPYNDFLLTVMSGLSQLERDLISQRTKEGLASAKARGRSGGRPSKQNEKSDLVMTLYSGRMRITDIIKNTGLSRSTIHRIIKNHGEQSA